MRIALIDDDFAVLDSLALYLKRQAVAVTCFITAEEFIATRQWPPFDCVVADVRMPGLSGIDLVRASRRKAVQHRLSLLPVTAILIWRSRLSSSVPLTLLRSHSMRAACLS